MRIVQRTRYQRVTNFAFAFVLAISSIAAAGPFVFSQRANAVSGTQTVCATGCNFNDLQAAIDAIDDGSTIELRGDLTTTGEVVINKPLTLRGLGHTISPNFAFVANWDDNSVIEIIGTTGVTINNLTIEGSGGTELHGINVYEATASINNTRSLNNDKSGVVVNRSNVTLAGVATSGNAWHGVNADTSNGIPTTLTVKQAMAHDELLQVYVDDATEPVTVIDTNGQYGFGHLGAKPNDRVYRLAPSAPQNLRLTKDAGSVPLADGDRTADSNVTLRWDTVSYVDRYQVRVTDPNGDSQQDRHTGWYTFDLNDNSRHGYFGSLDGTWTYSVRAQDQFTDTWSTWSDPITLVYDSTPAEVVDINQTYETKQGGRVNVVVTFEEAIDGSSLGQGWYEVAGSNGTQFSKIYYSQKQHTVSYTDLLGNSGDFTFTVDFTDPTVTVEQPAGDATISNNVAYLTNGTATDAAGIDRVVLLINDENGQRAARFVQRNFSGDSWTIEVPAGTLADGVYTFNFNVYDTTGHSTTERYQITVDNTAPVMTIDAIETVERGDVAEITGTISGDYVDYSVTVNGVTYTPGVSGNVWTLFIDTDALVAGSYVVTANASDAYGNQANQNAPIEAILLVNEPATVPGGQTGGSGEELEGEDNPDENTVDSPVSAASVVTPLITNPGSAVLGVESETSAVNDEDDADVEGASTVNNPAQAIQDEAATGSLFGLAWYWWLLILAALAAIIGAIVAAARRRSGEA